MTRKMMIAGALGLLISSSASALYSASQRPLGSWLFTAKSESFAQSRPRILLIYDMEGLAGVDRYSMVDYDSLHDYTRGRSALAADVNAVIAGLADAGVRDISVADRHGSGYEEGPDLPADQLDPRG